jgi:glutamine amidotransferase
MIVIIDYGMGNLRSVQKAFEFIGHKAVITSDADIIQKADKLVLPGVGAFRDAMTALKDNNLISIIKDGIGEGKPFLGICLGMQILFEKSYEDGVYQGLGIIPGEVKKFDIKGLKVPHIGWNEIKPKEESRYLNNLPDNMVYFVHSYCCVTEEKYVDAVSEYGNVFTAAVRRGNVFATQFHPEKSGDTGIEILKRFGGVV